MRDYINQAERLKDYRRMLEDGHGRLKDRDERLRRTLKVIRQA
jgi:hypothetical protein